MPDFDTQVAALSGVTGYWKLTEGSGTTAANSIGTLPAGSAGTGMVNGPQILRNVVRPSLALDGNKRVVVNDTTASGLDITTAGCVIVTVRPSVTKTQHAVAKPSAWNLTLRGSSLEWGLGGLGVTSRSNILFPNNTLMLMGRYDGVNQDLIVNGRVVATNPRTGSVTVNNNALEFGSFSGAEFMQGSISSVIVCTAAPSLASLRDLFVEGFKTAAEVAGLAAQVFGWSREILATGTRTRVIFTNPSDGPVWLARNATAVVGGGIYLAPNGGTFETTVTPGDAFQGISNAYLGGKLVSIYTE